MVRECKELLAINCSDMGRISMDVAKALLANRLDLVSSIEMHFGGYQQYAYQFTCPLLVAASLCDTIRQMDVSAKRTLTKVYVMRNPTRSNARWYNVGGQVLLTLVDSQGKVILNPKVFPDSVELLEVADVELRNLFD